MYNLTKDLLEMGFKQISDLKVEYQFYNKVYFKTPCCNFGMIEYISQCPDSAPSFCIQVKCGKCNQDVFFDDETGKVEEL